MESVMTDDARPKIPVGKLEWGVIIAVAVSVLTSAFNLGVVYADVRDHERRLIIVETRGEGVSERLARIESNLEFLVEQYRQDRKGRG
jgi:hypothetical protein